MGCIFVYIFNIPITRMPVTTRMALQFLYGKPSFVTATGGLSGTSLPSCHHIPYDLVSLSHAINAKETRIRVPPKSGCRIEQADHPCCPYSAHCVLEFVCKFTKINLYTLQGGPKNHLQMDLLKTPRDGRK